MDEVPVIVTAHALDRMHERFPRLRGGSQRIVREVREALSADRRSPTRPLWASTYTRPKRSGSVRFVWTAELDRCYVITRKKISGRGTGWFVITTLDPGNPEMLERVALSRGEPNQTRTGKHAAKSERVWKRGFQA